MTEITKDWCINMAKAEEAAGDPEIGAGGLLPICKLSATCQANMDREADIVDDLYAQRERAALCGDRASALLIDKHILGLFWQELLDKDDRTSPADFPEMALITREELAYFISRAAPSRS